MLCPVAAQPFSPHTRGWTPVPDAMAVFGPAPELVNARLAMVAFAAAAAAELQGGGSVLAQAQAAPTGVAALGAVLTLASLVPICAGMNGKRQGPGPFTSDAELVNGRLAMVAFATQLALELQFGNTLF